LPLTRWINNSQRVDMSLHSDTLFWFQAKQSLLFLLNDAFLAEKQQIPILYSFVWPDRGSYPQSIPVEASTLNITLPMRFPIFIFIFINFFSQNFLLSFNILFKNKNWSKTIRVTWYLYRQWEFLLLMKHSLNIANNPTA
jgi:hypothetical protein